jgi:hypothetical protein
MDPREYDRIADLLCQIRSKIANNLRTTTEKGRWTKELYLDRVNALLINTDELADVDQKGLI